MTAAPGWAVILTNQVCKDYRRKAPRLQWYCSKYYAKSSGRAGWGKIHVTAGTDERDQKLVLLHELAHHLTQRRQKQKARYHLHPRYSRTFEGHSRGQYRICLQPREELQGKSDSSL